MEESHDIAATPVRPEMVRAIAQTASDLITTLDVLCRITFSQQTKDNNNRDYSRID